MVYRMEKLDFILASQRSNINEHSIFGDYECAENRVTVALLHILRVGGKPLLTYLVDRLGGCLPCCEIVYSTQVAETNKNGKSVYDGLISCDCRWQIVIESKIQKNALRSAQVEKYRKNMDADAVLLGITPDDKRPECLFPNELWANWHTILKILEEYVGSGGDQNDLLVFLVKQFVVMLDNMQLTDSSKGRVIVVGGSYAEAVALDFGYYHCQPNRYFEKAEYMAFAYDNRIKYLFEIVEDPLEAVDLTKHLPENFFTKYSPAYLPGNLQKLFKLKFIKEFTPAIENDLVSKTTGRRVAFTQGQRYTTYDKIMKAKYTSDLL